MPILLFKIYFPFNIFSFGSTNSLLSSNSKTACSSGNLEDNAEVAWALPASEIGPDGQWIEKHSFEIFSISRPILIVSSNPLNYH